ncbi:hypothetical protein [Microbulbifer epialgicus]|uniref:Uncharacterized protein n=1 Tax=Microbulbifer epialgicus TaxID=393907 RepID=A0ABV4NZH8_9GAMM
MQKTDSTKYLSDAKLKRQLRLMPIAEPGPDLEARLLSSVMRKRRTELNNQMGVQIFSGGMTRRFALAAGLLLALGIAMSLALIVSKPPTASVVQNQWPSEGREVQPVVFLLHSGQQMLGATIRVTLPDNVRLDGYADTQVLQWRADISLGNNRLTLPVEMLESAKEGEILIEVEYRGLSKRLRQPVIRL